MECEKKLLIQGEGICKNMTYLVKKGFSEEFGIETYSVGINCNGEERTIENFSPSGKEAAEFCNYLYRENVSLNHLFLIGEEFITETHI